MTTSLEMTSELPYLQPTVEDLLTNVTANTCNSTYVYNRYDHPDMLQIFAPIAWSVDRYVTPITYAIGFCGNTLSAAVWLQKRMRSNNSSAIYLATLSITDLLMLMLHIMMELKYAWGLETLAYPVICESYFIFYLTFQYLSPLLVLGFTVERYIAVCLPFKKEKFCSTKRAIKVVIGLILLSLILCAMQGYFWTMSGGQCTVREPAYRGGDKSLWAIYTWITEMLIFLLVPVVILVFNILVIKEVKILSARSETMLSGQHASNTGRATTVMLLSVSFYVIFTTLPATIVYCLSEKFPDGNVCLTDYQIHNDPTWIKRFNYLTGRKIVEELCLTHYACNFFLYLITGVHFRWQLIKMLKCTLSKGLKGGVYSEIIHPSRNFQNNTTKL